jgi:hypothetical protein
MWIRKSGVERENPMAMWFYQLSEQEWPAERYRLDIWENECVRWRVGKISGDEQPKPGERVAFFYAKTGCREPGFYGWAVILRWESEDKEIYFRPVAPSNQLKMHPWWDQPNGNAARIADAIRGPQTQATLWPIRDELVGAIGAGIASWVGRCVEGMPN